MYHFTMSMPDKYKDHPLRYSPYFRTPHPISSTYPQQLKEQLNASMEVLEERMSTFMKAGSRWTLEENHTLALEMVDYEPIGGSSYQCEAVINVKNEDQQCFNWSILATLHPASKDAQRITKYQEYKDELNFTGINFPVTIDQIGKFEKNNPRISVTVIGVEEEKTKQGAEQSCSLSLRVPDKQLENHVVLLYWQQKEQYDYAWVKNLNRLLSRTKSVKNQTFFCERCFQGFIRSGLLKKHSEIYQHIPIQAVTVVDQEISFKNWAKTEETLFRIYGEFECILKECAEGEDGKTVKVQKHIPCSVAWVLISDHPDVESRSMLFRPSPTPDSSPEDVSEQVIDELMTCLQAVEKELLPYQLGNKPMAMTENQEATFQAETHCYLCEEPFYEDELKWHKVRDHNHAKGEYRGAAHAVCNLMY